MEQQIFGVLGGVLSLVAYVPYIRSIFAGKTRPSRSSWWIWSIVGLLIVISYYDVGARSTIWIPIVFFICPLIVAIFSLKYGANKKLSNVDKVCLLLAASSIIFFFENSAITLFINIGVDFIGFVATFVKTFYDPLSEEQYTWLIFLFGSVFNLLAIDSFSGSVIIYPVYMFVMDIIMLLLIFRKKFQHLLKFYIF